MLKTDLDKNSVLVAGHISGLKYDFSCNKEKFYKGTIFAKRMSDKVDKLPVVISEKRLDSEFDYEGQFVEITGEYRSVNKDGKLILYIFATSISALEYGEWSINLIDLTGYICKNPKLRKTPKTDTDITELIIAVNGRYGKNYYIPCIAWGRTAKYAAEFPIGTRVELEGRIQSREYNKKISDKKYEIRTAYEVSIKEFKEVQRDDKN